MSPGWIGDERALLYYLSVAGADRDGDGKFLVRGEVSSFMGASSEVVVAPDTVYFIEGAPKNLAAALSSTSAGFAVAVV